MMVEQSETDVSPDRIIKRFSGKRAGRDRDRDDGGTLL